MMFPRHSRFIYYFFSLVLLWAIPSAVLVFHETNLPPLQPIVRLVINGVYLNLAFAYFIFQKNNPSEYFKKYPLFFVAFIAAGFCAVGPIFSGDLMEYLIRGRIFAIYHENPYRHFPQEFPQDMLYLTSTWLGTPDAYGPLFLILKSIPVILFPNSLIGMVGTMKILTLVFTSIAVYFFYRIARTLSIPVPGRLAVCFAFNPLLFVMTAIDGLNDGVMLCFLLVAFYFLLKKKDALCFFFWALSFLVKYISILYLPFFLIFAVKRKASSVQYLWIPVVTIVAAFYPLWAGLQTFGTLLGLGQRFYSNTIPYAFYQLVSKMGIFVTESTIKHVFFGIFSIGYLLLTAWLVKDRESAGRRLASCFAISTLLFYFYSSSPFVYNYFVWALPWLFLCQWPNEECLITLFSFAALFSYCKRVNYLLILAAGIYFLSLLGRKFFHLKPKEMLG